MNSTDHLYPPAAYYPLEKGVYEVAPGLFPFGHDFGNGTLDTCVFQFDREFPIFRDNKEACRKESLKKYYVSSSLPQRVQMAAAAFIFSRLLKEWPQFFIATEDAAGGRTLRCSLTGEELKFSADFSHLQAPLRYASVLDALISQAPEDVAIVVRDTSGSGQDRLALLHVCSPTHWSPEEKAGLDFIAMHAPVPGIERLNRAAAGLVHAMIHKGPYVRFVWSFVTDRRLNHHPVPPPGEDAVAWRGRSFDESRFPEHAPFMLRIERQITWGLPEVDAALFFIRVSFIDGREIRNDPERARKLLSTLESMSQESRRYKGVEHCFEDLTGWLKTQ